MLDYLQFKDLLKANDISVKKVAEIVGMTTVGLKYALENGSLRCVDLESICRQTGITADKVLDLDVDDLVSPDGITQGESNIPKYVRSLQRDVLTLKSSLSNLEKAFKKIQDQME